MTPPTPGELREIAQRHRRFVEVFSLDPDVAHQMELSAQACERWAEQLELEAVQTKAFFATPKLASYRASANAREGGP